MRKYHSIAILALLFQTFAKETTHLPSQLFTQTIQHKLYKTASNTSIIPTTFPEYTAVDNSWTSFPIPTWTDGFFSSALYLLDTRAKLCHDENQVDWVSLGQTWSTGLLALETVPASTLDHDVGFLSYPFQKELLV